MMTALQELINKWELEEQEMGLVPFNGIVAEAKKNLEKEKQQIIDAYETGDKYKFEISGEQYYKETYGRNGFE